MAKHVTVGVITGMLIKDSMYIQAVCFSVVGSPSLINMLRLSWLPILSVHGWNFSVGISVCSILIGILATILNPQNNAVPPMPSQH